MKCQFGLGLKILRFSLLVMSFIVRLNINIGFFYQNQFGLLLSLLNVCEIGVFGTPKGLLFGINIYQQEGDAIEMAIIRFPNIENNRWYKISLFADHCKANNRTIEPFEAKFNGEWWEDINGVQYSVYSVIFIDDELAY